MSAITTGRTDPGPRSALPLPSLVDDEYLQESGNGVQPGGTQPMLSWFVLLHQISAMSEDLAFVDLRVSEDEEPIHHLRKLLDHALANGRRIDDFEKGVSTHLKTDSRSLTMESARKLQDLLRIRYVLVSLWIYAMTDVLTG